MVRRRATVAIHNGGTTEMVKSRSDRHLRLISLLPHVLGDHLVLNPRRCQPQATDRVYGCHDLDHQEVILCHQAHGAGRHLLLLLHL